jgi:hypothetical protein
MGIGTARLVRESGGFFARLFCLLWLRAISELHQDIELVAELPDHVVTVLTDQVPEVR